MGEKLLAQRIMRALRETHGRTSRVGMALLDWAYDQREWLWPQMDWPDEAFAPLEEPGGAALVLAPTLGWEQLAELIETIETAEPEAALFACTAAISDLLGFDAFEREVLRIAVALERLPRLTMLRSRLFGCGEDLVALTGRLAGKDGSDAGRAVRRSAAVKLGLLFSGGDLHTGSSELGVDWRFAKVLDEGLTDAEQLIDALAGVRQRAVLTAKDFAEHASALRLLLRLLRGALEGRVAGVNLLIYGPPGTGKTEFARTLAAELGAELYAVGEADNEGEEPSRLDRLSGLRRAQRLLARRERALLLFDEMEDLFSDASLYAGAGQRRTSSKVFVNRLLETNMVPTIWTSNAIEAVDPAHLRRMSYILRMDYPGARARARIVARVAEAEGVAEAGAGLAPLLPAQEETAGVARAALRAAALTGGGADDAEAVGRALLLGLRGGRAPAPLPSPKVELDLYEADVDVERLVDRVAAPAAPNDVSLLLTGAPGTGKTGLAAHLAQQLDRPLMVRRASDLLSAWVGETEANIAAAFAQARDRGAVLLFDEADSLLFDRSDARRSWKVSQVNELLTWMDLHPLPFVAATNHPGKLDPAALRRFVFKIELKPLAAARAGLAFERFFGAPAPAGLARVEGLTPGDFAVVKRQLRYRPEASAADILALLEAEAGAKPEGGARLGF
jgi:transitional endoplasmic reticulum ATPase